MFQYYLLSPGQHQDHQQMSGECPDCVVGEADSEPDSEARPAGTCLYLGRCAGAATGWPSPVWGSETSEDRMAGLEREPGDHGGCSDVICRKPGNSGCEGQLCL